MQTIWWNGNQRAGGGGDLDLEICGKKKKNERLDYCVRCDCREITTHWGKFTETDGSMRGGAGVRHTDEYFVFLSFKDQRVTDLWSYSVSCESAAVKWALLMPGGQMHAGPSAPLNIMMGPKEALRLWLLPAWISRLAALAPLPLFALLAASC